MDRLEVDLSTDYQIGNIAKTVGFTQYSVCRQFNRYAGMHWRLYMNGRRLTTAAQLLRDTNLRVIDIAMEVGYTSQQSFTRAFIRMFGVAPAKYRRHPVVLPWMLPRSLTHQHNRRYTMDTKTFVSGNVKFESVKLPARQLICRFIAGSCSYHDYCDHEGSCEAWGVAVSIPNIMGPVAAWWRVDGQDGYLFGAEALLNTATQIPVGFTRHEFAETQAVKISHPPYQEELHDVVCVAVAEAVERFDPSSMGMVIDDTMPRYEMDDETGYSITLCLKPL